MSTVELFAYGGIGDEGYQLPEVPYVVIDLEATGFNAGKDRIVELALNRIEAGHVVDEWASVLDPGCDPGPTFLHHISAEMTIGAPTFRDIMGDVLERLDGAVVVAHNARFEEKFLRAEFDNVGVTLSAIPALCTLRLSRQLLVAPNYRLKTCCAVSDITMVDAHTALGDVRATARLLSVLLARAPEIRFPSIPASLPRYPRRKTPRTRVTNLRKGHAGWMRSLLAKLPHSMPHHDVEAAQDYVDALAHSLTDGTLTGRQARTLGKLAGKAGMGAAQVEETNKRFLDKLRQTAVGDGALTPDVHLHLNKVARLLNMPHYWDDIALPPRTTAHPPTVVRSPQLTNSAEDNYEYELVRHSAS